MAKNRPWGMLKQVKNRDWTDSYELYSQEPDFYMGYYYIHKHKENIGRMGLKSAESDLSLANLFNSYKYGKDAFLSNTVVNQYKNLMDASMDINVMTLVNSVFNPENSIENLLNKIHADLQQGFEEQFTPNKIIQMLNIEKDTNWSSSNKKNLNAKNVQALAEMLSGNMKHAKQGFVFLDEILTGMAQAVQLLNSSDGDALASILSNTIKRKHYTVSQVGKELTQQLNDFVKHHNGDTIDGMNALRAAGLLQTVASGLETGVTKKGKALTVSSLQGLVQKQFYSMLAEIFIGSINEAAENAAVKYIVRSIKDINNGAGTDEVPIEATDPEGNYFTPTPHYLNDGEKKFGKADAKFNNVQVSLKSYTGEENGYFTMSVGISNKAYITNHIGEGSLKRFSVYSLGGGMTIGNALSLLLGGSGKIREKYLAYNIFSQGDSLPSALQALQDVLLTRSIVYLAGARGKADFAQFMLLNGELLSVWDIVKFAIGNNIGRSSSQQGHNNSGIYLSIPNRKIFMKYAQSRFWARRVVKTNVSITNAAMKAHIVPKQIIEYASANMPTT